MKKFESPAVKKVFTAYPDNIKEKMLFLRQLVFETAAETEGVGEVEETLKWGEPSYVTKTGSTIRMDWKPAQETQYAMYFNCKTRLIETYKEIYRDRFKFEGNRAIVFHIKDRLPIEELKHCIALALTYHKVKHLPLLGV